MGCACTCRNGTHIIVRPSMLTFASGISAIADRQYCGLQGKLCLYVNHGLSKKLRSLDVFLRIWDQALLDIQIRAANDVAQSGKSLVKLDRK